MDLSLRAYLNGWKFRWGGGAHSAVMKQWFVLFANRMHVQALFINLNYNHV